VLEAAADLEVVRTLADLGMLGAVLIGGGGVWFILRNGKNGNGRLMEAFRQREKYIEQMLQQLGTQGEHIQELVGEQKRGTRAVEQLVDRLDKWMFGKFGRLDQ